MTRRAWEPPLFEWSQLGPVPVELSDAVTDDNGNKLAGCALIYDRRVILDSGLEDRAMRVVHYHEMLHLWLHDAGVVIPEGLEEVVWHRAGVRTGRARGLPRGGRCAGG